MEKVQLAKIMSDPENPTAGAHYFEYLGAGKNLADDAKAVLLRSRPYSKSGKRVIVLMDGSAMIE
jgi:hypothetical protein